MSVNYTVQLTTGDSTTNYDIYYDAILSSNYAILISNGLNATAVTYNDLFNGVGITIPNNSSSIIIKSNGLCKNDTIIPIKPQLPPAPIPDLCMTFTFDGDIYQFQFTPNGTLNGRTRWTYFDGVDTYEIIWNPTVSNNGTGNGRWEMNFIFVSNTIFTTLNVSNIPDSGWYATGIFANFVINLQVAQGICSAVPPLNAEVEVTNTSCKNTTPCNGSIVVYPVGGSGVYQYSINGLSYQQSNIFNGLCENTYLVTVQDTNGTIFLLNATVGYDNVPKTYNGSIVTTNQITLIDSYRPQRRKVVQTDWELQFDNTIDVGTTINFLMSVVDSQTIYGPGSGQISGQTLVYLNSVLQTTVNTITNTYTIPRAFCAGENFTGTTINNSYQISMTNADRVTGTSISEMIITNPDVNASGCATLLNNAIDVQNNVNSQNPVSGCQCCTVNFGKNSASIIKDEIQI
jgi:hypothetical protein